MLLFQPLLLFIEIRWLDVVDILLVAYLIYRLYFIVKGTSAINIFVGILGIYVLWKIVEAFQMEMLSEILGQFIGVGVIALIIVFQQEIRKFLLSLGQRGLFTGKRRGFLKQIFNPNESDSLDTSPIKKAVHLMAKHRTGALIIVARKSDPSLFVIGGQKINAKINSDLILSVFNKESPLHDGAMIIKNQRIDKVQCVLSLSENADMPDGTGLRHRSALGIAEQSDAVAIIVSEQTGKISIAIDSKLIYNLSPTLFDHKIDHLFKSENSIHA